MQHLTLEDVARLVDEPPAEHESLHLRSCLHCRRELEEMRSQTEMLADLPDPEPTPGAWRALEARLLEEGLVRQAAPPRRIVAWWARPGLRAAAAAALFVLGGAAGAALWSSRVPGAELASVPGGGAGAAGTAKETAEPAYEGAPVVEDVGPTAAPGVRFASGSEPAASDSPRPSPLPADPRVRAAERELADAQSAYVAALRRYAAIADPSSGADPETRLAALDRLVGMTRQALNRAPDDPVINGYHTAAVQARDSMLRQIAQTDTSNWF